MARRKAVKPRWNEIELKANVWAHSTKDEHGVCYRASQAEMHEMFDVKDRTLRDWAHIGLPTEKGPQGKTVYPFPDANIWAMCYRAKCLEDRNRRGPAFLSMEQADAWHLANQMEDDPAWFVIVPLSWDHPMRQAQLERAAQGNDPGPSDVE